jgi:hypothetical protein
MRRFVFSIIVASGLVMIGAGPAFAEPAATAVAEAKAVPGKKMCRIASPLLNELSGLVATKSGYIAINDSTDLSSRKRIFFLNQDCGIGKSVPYPGGGPRDTEDMVLSADGKTLWISDAGDNSSSSPANQRQSIVIWTLPVNGSSGPKLHRLVYPNGEHHDSEALLLTGDDVPVVVTKEAGKPAVMYEPAGALKSDNATGVPMKKVGEFRPPETNTAGTQFARLFRQTVTGGAIAPDGNKIVLRTYTDAYEWDVTNGDVVGAVKAKPRQTPLENEPFGEAITYSADGKYFYTVSDMQGSTGTGDNVNFILRYTPATKVVTADTSGSNGATPASSATPWYKNFGLDDITYIVGGVGVLGAILVGLGVMGIVRSRKKPFLDPKADAPVAGGPIGPKPSDAATELLAVGGPPSGRPGGPHPGVHGGGGARPGTAVASGPVYGAKQAPPSAPQRGGGVYGGAPQGGSPVQPVGRPPQGGGRPPHGGGRPPQGGGRPPQGGQPGARPPQGGQPMGRPPQGGQVPGRPGVYGAPPAQPPSGSDGRGPSQR